MERLVITMDNGDEYAFYGEDAERAEKALSTAFTRNETNILISDDYDSHRFFLPHISVISTRD